MNLMNSKSIANLFGYASIVCSLLFWVGLCLDLLIPAFRRLDLSLNSFAVIWLVAVVLAFTAAALGSRRWALAALLPVATFLVVMFLIFLREPR